MKLTKENLVKIIKEVISENKKKSMLLYEGARTPKYDRIVAALEGKDTDVKTVVIMSGQNPMAQGPKVTGVSPETYAASNMRLAAELEKAVQRMGVEYDRIGGIFGGLPEKSLLIYNIDQWDGDKLCRQFKQWGFVWGEKYPINAEQDFMAFKMLVIDYDKEAGWYKDPNSKETGFVMKNKQLAGVTDNVSLDPTSGKKFGLELYEEGEDK